jgi:hypothetical protein
MKNPLLPSIFIARFAIPDQNWVSNYGSVFSPDRPRHPSCGPDAIPIPSANADQELTHAATARPALTMRRQYKASRKPAPPLWEMVRLRSLGQTLAEIAASYGCHRQTLYAALDRAADRGELPPVLVPVIYPDDHVAATRLLQRIHAAKASGIEVAGWNRVDTARARYSPPVVAHAAL